MVSYAVTGIVTARTLGPTGRGQLTLVMLWSGLIYSLGTLGLPKSLSYHLALWPDRRWALTSWLKRVAIRQAIVLTVISAAIFWWLYAHFHLPPLLAFEYITWAAAGTVYLYGNCYSQGLSKFSHFNWIRVISGVLPAVLIIVGSWTVRLTTTEAGAAYLIPTWCSAVVVGILLHRSSHRMSANALSKDEIHSLWSYGWRSVTSASSLILNNSSDQFVLGLLVPISSLGIYSVAASVSSPLPIIISSFGMVGLPAITQLTGEAKAAASSRVMRRAEFFTVLIAVPLALLLPWLIPWLYGARYSAAVLPGELLLIGTVGCALATVTDDLIRAYGFPGFVTVTQGAGGIVTILGTVLLARRSLDAVSIASSVGFGVAFTLALARLWLAAHRLGGTGGAPEAECASVAPVGPRGRTFT